MAVIGVGLLGCGVVGSAVVRGLSDARLAGQVALRRVAVRDPGAPRDCVLGPDVITDDAWAVVADPGVEVVVEAIGGLDPATELIGRALDAGKPVVTANKAVLGAAGPTLRALAAAAGVPLLFEGAVAGAVPVIRGLSGLARSDELFKVEGLLNATTTFVLSHIQANGGSVDEALGEARRLGYAEADASRDLDGSDAADKLAVLVQYLFGEDLRTDEVQRLGLDALDPQDLVGTDRCWRLLATAVRGRCARVEPVALRPEHPFAQVTGAAAAITVIGERSGATTLIGQGAGGQATACSVLADVLAAADWLTAHRGQPDAVTVTERETLGVARGVDPPARPGG